MNTIESTPHFNAPLLTLEEMWRFLQNSSMDFDRRLKESKALEAERAAAAEKSRIDFDKRMKELSRQLGGQANRLGEFVQEMVRPAVVRLFQERGLPVHQVLPNMKGLRDDGKLGIEVDLVVVNTETLIAVECKSKLTQDGVDEHLERLAAFKHYFPQLKNHTVLGAVAGMVIADEVRDYAHSKGLYVLAQSGDSVEIHNPETFEPVTW
ncbi:MAG: hypothetical protein RIR79_538 [Pseudomonadota bacterium]|jgi:hypothetical protein